MNTDLTAIKAALADISDVELRALIAATYGVPQSAPGLLAWIDGACDWEVNRRARSRPNQDAPAAVHLISLPRVWHPWPSTRGSL